MAEKDMTYGFGYFYGHEPEYIESEAYFSAAMKGATMRETIKITVRTAQAGDIWIDPDGDKRIITSATPEYSDGRYTTLTYHGGEWTLKSDSEIVVIRESE